MNAAAPGSAAEAYGVAQGYPNKKVEIIDPITGKPTKFGFSGDPITGGGFVDNYSNCGDRWFHLSSGPFTMAPGDSQEVIGAYVIGQSYEAIYGVPAVKAAAGHARLLYLNNFEFERHKTETHEQQPEQFRLSHPYPNPFNEKVTVEIDLPRDCQMSLAVYNAAGRFVKKLYDGQNSAGTYRYTWDGRNQAGAAVSSGLYLVRFSTSDVQGTQKLLLIR